jgi:hypothetical protein
MSRPRPEDVAAEFIAKWRHVVVLEDLAEPLRALLAEVRVDALEEAAKVVRKVARKADDDCATALWVGDEAACQFEVLAAHPRRKDRP